MPDIDRKTMLGSKTFGQFLSDNIAEGMAQSADGWVDDDLSCVRPWGFELSEIKVPVVLYQGSLDMMVPYAHGLWLDKHIPAEFCKAHLLEGEGHISIVLGRMEAMMEELQQYR
jgi:pimeloyl-ACP methyl ester carboxylesterase